MNDEHIRAVEEMMKEAVESASRPKEDKLYVNLSPSEVKRLKIWMSYKPNKEKLI
jgi:hypothetical protein